MKRYVHINIRKYPTQYLTDEEKENPYKVFADLFDVMSPPAFRELMWKSLSCNVTSSYSDLTTAERENIMFAYERTQKLIDAAHIINEHQKLRALHGQYAMVLHEEQEEEEQEESFEDLA